MFTGLLFWEYSNFKQEFIEAKELKAIYNGYISALKKLTSLQAAQLPVHSSEDQKKKELSTQANDSFVRVNRAQNYLKKSALEFGKKQGLEWSLRKLYDVPQEKKTPARKRVIKKRVRGKKQGAKNTSLKKSPLFVWPILRSRFRISSPFGPRKLPDGTWGFHKGIDLAAVHGTPIKSAAPGVVIEAGWARGFGNTIVIAHSDKYRKFKTRYAHLSKILTRVGKKVEVGEMIGEVGNTGNVRSKWGGDGSHLHFEIHLDNKVVNPIYYLA